MATPNIPPVTDEEEARWPAHGVVKLEKPFIDARGKIQPLVDEMMRSAVMIESKAGSIRANHYHKTDWHYCYVLKSGSFVYFAAHAVRPPLSVAGIILTPAVLRYNFQR